MCLCLCLCAWGVSNIALSLSLCLSVSASESASVSVSTRAHIQPRHYTLEVSEEGRQWFLVHRCIVDPAKGEGDKVVEGEEHITALHQVRVCPGIPVVSCPVLPSSVSSRVSCLSFCLSVLLCMCVVVCLCACMYMYTSVCVSTCKWFGCARARAKEVPATWAHTCTQSRYASLTWPCAHFSHMGQTART